jgi:hypothetical protein
MHTMTRFFALGAILPVFAALGCGGETTTADKINDAAPEEIPGGGIGSGAIDGKINVYAIDGRTDAPISGATVHLGDADAEKLLEGTTDATGLVTFKNAALQGAQTITVTAADHVTTSWFAVNGANVTIPLQPTKEPTVETANVSGTIAGWDMLTNAQGHLYVAFISSSWTGNLGDPANDIKQPPSTGLPPNTCIKLPTASPPCEWKLVARTGKQLLFAFIVDVDSKGTMDQADDTRSLYGYAFKPGLELKAGDNVTGQSLDLFPTDALVDLNVTVPMPPPGMDESAAIPLLDMGDEGQVPLFFGNELTIPKIPSLSGVFASGSYQFVARAGLKGKPIPSTVTITRGVDVSKAVVLPNFPATPTDIASNAGVYSFKPASGATIHSVHFDIPMGDRAWNITLYDGRTSFSLPAIMPDPLPVGQLNMRVEAVTVPGVDLNDFDARSAQDKVTAIGENGVEITH